MRKFITSIFIVILLFSVTIFTGYALYLFPGFVTITSTVDSLEQNWDYNINKYRETDTFKVYFRGPKDYVSDSVGYVPTEVNSANPLVVRTNLTNKEMGSIAVPSPIMPDKNTVYEFIGWSFSLSSATTHGYGGDGNLNLVDDRVSLQAIDKNGIDGSNISDGVIYLYAMYQPKNNNKPHSSVKFNDKPLNKMTTHDVSDESIVDSMNNTIYTYSNVLKFLEYEGGRLYTLNNMNINNLNNSINVEINNINKNINLTGINNSKYNIYYLDIISNDIKYDKHYFDNFFSNKYITNRYYNKDINNNHIYWIYIEELIDFDFMGGYTYSFDPNGKNEVFTYNPLDKLYNSREYTLKNIRFDNNINHKYKFKYNGYINEFSLNTFTVLPKFKNNINIKVKAKVPKAETGGTEYGFVGVRNATGVDYKIDNNINNPLNILNNNIIKTDETGLFDVVVGTNMSQQDTLQINVGLKHHTHDVCILIYENKSDIKVIDSNSSGVGFLDVTRYKPLYVSASYFNDIDHSYNALPIGKKIDVYSNSFVDISRYNKYKPLPLTNINTITNGTGRLYNYYTDNIFDFNNTRISENIVLYVNNR